MNQHAIFFGMRSPAPGAMYACTGAETAAAALAATEGATAAAAAGGLTAAEVGAMGAAAGAGSFGGLGASDALSLGMQVGGHVVRSQAEADALKRKQRLVDAMAAYQTKNADKAMEVTGKFIDGATPEARAAAMDAAELENKAGYEKTVGAAQAFEQPGGVSGKLSDQYTKASADSADAVATRTKNLIENLSKLRAPGVAGATESRRYARAAGGVNDFNNANASMGNAYRTDIANVQADPFAGVAGEAISGIGMGVADKMKKLRAGGL